MLIFLMMINKEEFINYRGMIVCTDVERMCKLQLLRAIGNIEKSVSVVRPFKLNNFM